MPHLRFDETVSGWVIFSPSRSRRPHSRSFAGPVADTTEHNHCPFCPGNEKLTPPEIYAERPNGRGWQVRVIPNKFPALRIEEDRQRVVDGFGNQWMGGCGAHEVLIESPEHSVFLPYQPIDQIERVLRTAQSRYNDLMRDQRFQTVIVFKNHGVAAGTSLAHPHWQLIATPVVPRLLRLKHFEAAEYFDRTGRCLYCVIAKRELDAQERMVTANKEFVAFCPYAAHVPFETWILPRKHQSSFGQAEPDKLAALASLLKDVLLRLTAGLDNPDYNLTIDTAPRGDEEKSYFLWHLRILPRLSEPAGFEMGSGMSINTVLPEESAKFLREVDLPA